jgi:hypothetical protein
VREKAVLLRAERSGAGRHTTSKLRDTSSPPSGLPLPNLLPCILLCETAGSDRPIRRLKWRMHLE